MPQTRIDEHVLTLATRGIGDVATSDAPLFDAPQCLIRCKSLTHVEILIATFAISNMDAANCCFCSRFVSPASLSVRNGAGMVSSKTPLTNTAAGVTAAATQAQTDGATQAQTHGVTQG